MKKFYILALVATMLAACTTDETQDLQPVDTPESLTVGFEGGDDDTRVQLNEAQKTVWTKDDLVSVFYRSDANQKWQFQGETGERVGNLKRVSAGSATETMKRVVVVYPYNENYYINTETYNVEATLPATQTYLKDSYGLDGNLMVSSDEFTQISLKSVYGWLKLQLTGEGEMVTSITLHGNNNEQVAGLVYINSSNASITLAAEMGSADDPEVGGAGGNLVFDDTIQTEVALNCGNGVELGAEATAFYIALPPQTFEKGLTVEIETAEGKIMTKSTDKSLTIERNTIQPMASVAYNGIFKPANNEIYYTNGSTTEATAPNKTAVFGANIISNLYDADKACWVITFDGDVTKIGDSAFDGYDNTDCRKITSVTIPDSVTSIGYYAFCGCTSLTSITIPDSVTKIGGSAFDSCKSLTSVTIPDSVTSIGYGAFYNCTSLKSITIPDSVTSIGSSAFRDCTLLKTFYGKFASADNRCLIVDGVLNSFAIGCGATSYTIPDSVTKIGDYAFADCTSLTSVTIPDSVTSIGYQAFSGCTSLTSVNIPNSVTSIGSSAFSDCTSLTSVTIGNGVTSIGVGAFSDCTSLTKVTIPNSVTSIGGYAFEGCTSLTNITIPDSVTAIKEGAFSNCTSLTRVDITDLSAWCKINFGDNPLRNGAKLYINNTEATDIIIPSDITEIKNYAFDGCTSLTSVTIPDSVTSIGRSAFDGCTSLTNITIPDSVTSIEEGFGYYSNNPLCNGAKLYINNTEATDIIIPSDITEIKNYAFYNCTSLTSVTIPDSVTSIGRSAFGGCTSLKTVYCKPTTPPTGGLYMFDINASDRKIYVPASDDDGIINAYKAKQYWSDYASYIEEYDFSAGQ